MSERDAPPPGSYANYRHIIDDPQLREAFLVQVKGTVEGLRGAYRWHAIAAVVAKYSRRRTGTPQGIRSRR